MASQTHAFFESLGGWGSAYLLPSLQTPWGPTGYFSTTDFANPIATTENPAILFYSQIKALGINFGQGNGWELLSDSNGVYQTLTSTQKANITAGIEGWQRRPVPGSLISVLFQLW